MKSGPLFFRQYAKNLLLKSLLDILRCAYRHMQLDNAVAVTLLPWRDIHASFR